MKRVSQTTQFARDVKRMRKRGKDLAKLREVVRKLAAGHSLDARHRDHDLIGPWQPSRDCHIEPDWLLIYLISDFELRLVRLGTHSELFD